jgi:hypothetical protein
MKRKPTGKYVYSLGRCQLHHELKESDQFHYPVTLPPQNSPKNTWFKWCTVRNNTTVLSTIMLGESVAGRLSAFYSDEEKTWLPQI